MAETAATSKMCAFLPCGIAIHTMSYPWLVCGLAGATRKPKAQTTTQMVTRPFWLKPGLKRGEPTAQKYNLPELTMAAIRLVLLGLVATGAEGGACNPVDSCPKLSDGLYCPVNDITEHADINRDVALIKRYLEDTPDYAMAREVYTMGNFSSSNRRRA